MHMESELTINKLQECIRNIDHKNNSNEKYMLKLMEEVGELAEVIRKNKRMEEGKTIKGTIEEELQDVLENQEKFDNILNTYMKDLGSNICLLRLEEYEREEI